jgi:cell wall-associated NlpC family hydrolase
MPSTPHLLRVRAAVAPLLGEPRIATVLTSELPAGWLLVPLERRDDWWHVEGEDGYRGWVHAGYLEAATGEERDWPVTTGARVRRADGAERALPFGARVAPEARVLAGEVHDAAARAACFPPTRAAVIRTATQWFTGAPYRWGGVTPWGTDCSGFVQATLRLHGIALPRDAWQQAAVGTPVEPASAGAADLLFFSDRDDRHVTHVALALGDGRFVHSALGRGGVRVERWTDADAYVTRLRAQCTGARTLPVFAR